MTIDSITTDNEQVEHYPISQRYLKTFKLFPSHVTVNHWQLRDLICPSTSNPYDIYYTCGSSIRSLNIHTKKDIQLASLDFSPRCFTERDNIVISGGVISTGLSTTNLLGATLSANSTRTTSNYPAVQGGSSNWRGLFSIHDRANYTTISQKLGGYINNCVQLDKIATQQYEINVCNNDANLYVCDLSSKSSHRVTLTQTLPFEFQLNHCMKSNDGKRKVVVGDSNKIVVLNADNSTHTITTGCDNGFSTAFTANDINFATIFQDGTCLVFDTRNMDQPINKIHTSRPGNGNGAFRTCKFSGGTDDLLFISEHVGRIHVIDARDYHNHQVVILPYLGDDLNRFGANSTEAFKPQVVSYTEACAMNPMSNNEISGLAWKEMRNNSALFIGCESGIVKWDIDSWSRRSFSTYDFC